MRPSIALQTHRDAIREIALRHRVRSVRVFGSALHGNDTEDSDLDLLVEPTPETTLFDIGAIQYELKKLLGISVEVLTSMPACRSCMHRSNTCMMESNNPGNFAAQWASRNRRRWLRAWK